MAEWDFAGPLNRGFEMGFNARMARRRQSALEAESGLERAKLGGGTDEDIAARMSAKQDLDSAQAGALLKEIAWGKE